MGLKTGKVENGGSKTEIPIEPTIGLLSSVVHLGAQKNNYLGEESIVDQVFVQFELQDVLTEKGTPNEIYTASGLYLRNVQADAMQITADIAGLDDTSEPYPYIRATKALCPGLYR